MCLCRWLCAQCAHAFPFHPPTLPSLPQRLHASLRQQSSALGSSVRRCLTRHLPPNCPWQVLTQRALHHVPEPLLLTMVNTVGTNPGSDAWPPASQLLLKGVQWGDADGLLLATALLCHGHTLERRLLVEGSGGPGQRGCVDGGTQHQAVGQAQHDATAVQAEHDTSRENDGSEEAALLGDNSRGRFASCLPTLQDVAMRLCADEAVRAGHWVLRGGRGGGALRLLMALEWWALGMQLRTALSQPPASTQKGAGAHAPADAVCIDGTRAQRCCASASSPARRRHKKKHGKKKHKKRRRSSGSEREEERGEEVLWEYTPPGLDQGVVLSSKGLQTAIQQQALLAWTQWAMSVGTSL